MKIVNAHVHMIELESLAKKQQGPLIPGGVPVYRDIEKSLSLVRPETLIEQMDEADIAKSIIYAVEAPILYASNEYVSRLVGAFPDRLLGFASVNPMTKGAPEILERAIVDLGLRGLKLHPPLQNFFPNDESVFNVYEKACELNIPVVFHVGTTPFGHMCRLSQANPILIDDVATSFPNLRILLTHLGTLWQNEAFMVVEKNPNVFIDTAAYVYEIKELLNTNLVKRLGEDKIIFGTDYPSPFADEPHRMKDFVEAIQSLDFGTTISDKIFCENVETLLNGWPAGKHSKSAEELFAKFLSTEKKIQT